MKCTKWTRSQQSSQLGAVMRKLILVVPALFAFSICWAGGFAPGAAAQGVLDGMAASQQQAVNQQWMAMSRAWTNCINQGGDSCGPAPTPPGQPAYRPPPQSQQVTRPVQGVAPYCVFMAYSGQCIYYDASACRSAATYSNGMCGVNPNR